MIFFAKQKGHQQQPTNALRNSSSRMKIQGCWNFIWKENILFNIQIFLIIYEEKS
jgi:hypothetical protein